MMHRCGMETCSCGLYHNQTNSFSMLFSSMSSNAGYRTYDEGEMYSSPSSGSVDCTLSLGTPSTRRSGCENEKKRGSSFGWNIFPTSKHATSTPAVAKNHRGGGGGSGGGGDTLLARRCTSCDTTSTPLWRNGPRGPKSLCNACGIRFKKEERRATAAAATIGGGSAHGSVDGSWIPPQKMPYYSSAAAYGNEFRFVDDEDQQYRDSVMAWRFNVTDRASLVHH